MAKRTKIWKQLLVALSFATVACNAPQAMAHGGGHCGGGHCGGGHFGGAHFSSGAHFGGTHISCTHISSSHLGSHSSSFAAHDSNNNSSHGFSLFGGRSHHVMPLERMANQNQPSALNSNLNLQEIAHTESPSPYCSSIIRPESHAGFFGHIHRMFADKPCDLQNIHTEIFPRALAEIACLTPARCQPHQNFVRENLALSRIATENLCLQANAMKIRYLDQSNRNYLAMQQTQLYANYFNINIDNTIYPASDLEAVIASDNPGENPVAATADENTNIMIENTTPTFSGLSYMLPNPGGILNIYFSYESSINNFLQLQKASFLATAMHQLM